MTLILAFVIGFILSFLGSIPIGMITLTITQKTIEKGRSAGLMIALGATLMEFAYTFLALYCIDFFTVNAEVLTGIKITSSVVFLSLAIYYFFKKINEKAQKGTDYDSFDFFNGMLIGAMNLLIVPFWIFMALFLKSNGYVIESIRVVGLFSIGSALGALLVFVFYIFISESMVGKTNMIKKYSNRVVGSLFLGLGVYQLFQLL